jgi:GNAT superfamily N-acetyltransferase
MRLRVATAADADAIARLHAESWRSAYRGMYRDEYLDGPLLEDRMGVWRERLAAPPDNQYLLLAGEGDALLGFACSYGNEDKRWGTLLDNLHVRRDQHRHGIGRRLLSASALWSRERYPDALFHLWVLDGNANARRFYEHLGAQPEESDTHEPPGGGSVLVWRYVWQRPALEALIADRAG